MSQVNTPAWVIFTYVSFGAAVAMMTLGIWALPVDFWAKGPRHQRQMLWIVVGTWIVVMIPTVYFMLQYTVEKTFGSAS